MLVIDVQVGLFDAKPAPFEAAEVIQRINVVTSRARAAKVQVFLVQNDGPEDGDRLRPFAPDWQLHPDLRKETTDILIRKTTGDAFYGTDLEEQLLGKGIRSLVLTGYASDFCMDATIRNGASKEFELFVVSDAHTTNDAPQIKALDIREHLNRVWSDSASARGIYLVKTVDVEFSGSVSGCGSKGSGGDAKKKAAPLRAA